MPNDITFYQGVQSEYDGLSTKDSNGIYFLSDTRSIFKGDIRYGGGADVATSSTPGIIKPGADFDISSDGTLTLYNAIAIESFSHNSGTLELGRTITNTTLSWSLNKVPTALSIVSNGQTTDITPLVQSGTRQLTFATPLAATTSFKLTAMDARNASAERSITIQFLNGKYYGVGTVSAANDVDDAFVQGLTKQLTSGRTGSFTVTANEGQYIYFAIPASFGTPVFYVGGFEGGFDLLKTFDYTNSVGHSETYNVYKSTNAGLQQTTVEVR